MGALEALAALRVHALVVAVPGRPVLRLRAEAEVRRRGWVEAAEVEDADLLIVCGSPGPELAAAVDAAWSRVGAPRARRSVGSAGELPAALDSAARALADGRLQVEASLHAPRPAAVPTGVMGPVLARWPAGLVIELASRDGVVGSAVARVLPGERPAEAPDLDITARAVALSADAAARLAGAAGWPMLGRRLTGIVDGMLAGASAARARRPLRAAAALARRSEGLRRSLAGALPGVDVHDRLVRAILAAEAAVTDPAAFLDQGIRGGGAPSPDPAGPGDPVVFLDQGIRGNRAPFPDPAGPGDPVVFLDQGIRGSGAPFPDPAGAGGRAASADPAGSVFARAVQGIRLPDVPLAVAAAVAGAGIPGG